MTTIIICTTCTVLLIVYMIIMQAIHKKLKFITPFLFHGPVLQGNGPKKAADEPCSENRGQTLLLAA